MKLFSQTSPLIMGVLNVTPDSFSDGGRFLDRDVAVSHVETMFDEGADIIDIGAESTRPGSQRTPAGEQKHRVIDIISAIRTNYGSKLFVSIDTTLADVAEAALAAGADIINDISAGRDDPGLVELVADRGCPYIIMHMQGSPETMQQAPDYEDVVEDIRRFLLDRIDHLQAIGIDPDNIIMDPGIGFGKTREHNLAIIGNLHRFVDTGFPVLLGASRKQFMGSICQVSQPDQLTGATCATTVIGVSAGVRIFRVHDVRANRQAADVTWEIINAAGKK